MMTGSTIAALSGTMLALAVVPGPSDFAVVARSIASGFAHGLIMVCGIIAADLLFIVLAVYSLSVVADQLGPLFEFVNYACGAYLIWLGISSWKAASSLEHTPKPAAFSRTSSFISGLLITLGDPKAILFYMALFPAFLDVSGISLTDTIIIMLLATAVVGGVKLSYAYMAVKASAFFANTKARKYLDISAGSVLIGAGIFMLFRN